MTDRLPVLLDALLSCEVYGLRDGHRGPPANVRYGVYLFSEKGKPRYVGRVGLDGALEARRKGTLELSHPHARPHPSSSQRGHLRLLARRQGFRCKQLPLAKTRKANCEDPAFMEEFRRQCERVRAMDFQVVGIDDDRLAAVFEVYAATVLGLRQSFAVS